MTKPSLPVNPPPRRTPSEARSASPARAAPVYSVVMANWEGDAWIERALSSVRLAIRAARWPAETIVVDDASADASPATVAARFPGVRLLRNSRNRGFAPTINRGVRAARGEIVVLLNNDLVVREDFFRRLLAPFLGPSPDEPTATAPDAEALFAVSARTLSWDGTEANHLCMAARQIEGRIETVYAAPGETARCLFAQGGAMACRRDVFLAFGGFDPLFAPGYWEDYDLCWRAARAGYGICYEPRAVAFHVGGGSMTRRYGRKEVYLLRLRNHLLFEWLNLSDAGSLARHAAWLPRHVLREWTRGEGFGLSKALWRAVRLLPRVLRGRALRRAQSLRLFAAAAPPRVPLSDEQLLDIGKDFRLPNTE